MIFDHYVYQLRLEHSSVPFYIGKGKDTRYKRHFNKTLLVKNTWKNNVINKALREGVGVLSEIVVGGLTDQRAMQIEVDMITFYGRRDLGTGILTNLTAGGEGPSGIVRSEAWRKNHSEAITGKKASAETRAKMSASHSARKRTPEAVANLAAALRGRTHTEEAKKRMSEGKLRQIAEKRFALENGLPWIPKRPNRKKSVA